LDGVPGGGLPVATTIVSALLLFEETDLKSGSSNDLPAPQLNTRAEVNLETVYRSLLRIVAHLQGSEYTEEMLRQTEVYHHPDLADPASALNTSQG
jgi:hypothetical protein